MKNSSGPRIILWDIETLPNMAEAMKVFNQLSNYPGLTIKASINSIICVGWKVYGEKKVHCINAWDFKNWQKDVNDDKEIVKAAYEVLSKADCVVTHNGKRFDWKFFQTRLMVHGLDPLPKIMHVDTCQSAKSNLMLLNNKLATVAETLTSEAKLAHEGWGLWVKVSERDKAACAKMTAYCKQDVVTLEAVFNRLRPFVKVPNHNLFTASEVCKPCGSNKLMKYGFKFYSNKKHQRYKCKDCGTENIGA